MERAHSFEQTHPELTTKPDVIETSGDTSQAELDTTPSLPGWEEYSADTLRDGKKWDAEGNEVPYPHHLVTP